MWSCETMCHLTQITLMGHVTGQNSILRQKENKSNLNSTLNYKSPFCPFGYFKIHLEFGVVTKSKVGAYFIRINFGIQSFQSLHINFGVILK